MHSILPVVRRSRFHVRKPLRPRLVEREVIVPGLDPAHDGVRIAHLTDLHVGMLTPARKILRAVELAQAARPDLLFMTGDFVCYSPKFVGRLAELTRGIGIPTYCVLGNHDYWTDGAGVRRALERNGMAVLRNGHSEIQLKHAPLTVVRKHGSRVVLTHAPNMADRAAEYGQGLILAGHTHGGHVKIGSLTEKIAARFGNRYLAGFYEVKDALLYVNCGIGSSSVPIRAGAPSECAVFTLRAPAEERARHHHRDKHHR